MLRAKGAKGIWAGLYLYLMQIGTLRRPRTTDTCGWKVSEFLTQTSIIKEADDSELKGPKIGMELQPGSSEILPGMGLFSPLCLCGTFSVLAQFSVVATLMVAK